MKNLFSTRIRVVIVIAALFALITMGFIILSPGKASPMNNAVSVIMTPVKSATSLLVRRAETLYNYIFGYRALKTTPSGKVTLGFFKPTGSNLPANSAYLYSRYNVTTDAQGFAIFFDDDTTTAIDAVETAATADDNAPYYSLQGVRYAGKPAAGIYIHNGKKVIIK